MLVSLSEKHKSHRTIIKWTVLKSHVTLLCQSDCKLWNYKAKIIKDAHVYVHAYVYVYMFMYMYIYM